MSPRFFVRLPAMTFGILGFAFVVGQPTSVTAEQSYPWCAQGDNILHCYYYDFRAPPGCAKLLTKDEARLFAGAFVKAAAELGCSGLAHWN
jgi:hypothetical protein